MSISESESTIKELVAKGQQLEQAGEWEAARQVYHQALVLRPMSEETWGLFVASLAHEHNGKKLYAACVKALCLLSETRAHNVSMPKDRWGQIHYWLAQAYRQLGNPENMIFELKLATAYLPEHAQTQYELGIACWEEGRLPEAQSSLARALMLKYYNPSALRAFRNILSQLQAQTKVPQAVQDAIGKGLGLYQKQRFSEAIPVFQTVLKTFPNHAEALCYLGLCQLALRDPIGLANIEQATLVAPDNPDVLQHMAWCYMNAGQTEQAISLCKRSIQIQPTHVGAYTQLSELYQQQEQWDEAFESLKRAKYFDQKATIDSHALIALCENWVKANPQNGHAHYELGIQYLAVDNWPAAIAALTTALLYGYDQTDVYGYLGLGLLEMKDWSRAAQAAKTAIGRQPEQPLLYAMLAYSHFIGLKDARQALAECEIALNHLNQQTDLGNLAAHRRLIIGIMDKIEHPSRDDQSFWANLRRQIKAEVTHGI